MKYVLYTLAICIGQYGCIAGLCYENKQFRAKFVHSSELS